MTAARTGGPVRVEILEDGRFWRIVLDAPKGNVLDGPMIDGLRQVFDEARAAKDLRAVSIEGAGPNFSFGASVEEHLPGQVERMLPRFHDLFRAMCDAGVFLIAVVRGRCLGGGLEVAALCHRVFAAPDAELGQPEIALGVFAPVGSLVLARRAGYGAAADLCLTGRILPAETARSIGLVDEVAGDPFEAALAYAKRHLLEHSASTLRWAVRALRLATRPLDRLEEVERLYLDGLMATRDAAEGVRAFVEKRRPTWRNE